MIVDRVKVRADIKHRLADSFETALKYSQGLAVVCPMEDHKKEEEVIFSSQYSCPICGYSITELPIFLRFLSADSNFELSL